MVGNSIVDPVNGEEFDNSGNTMDTDPIWYQEFVPLWATATDQGIDFEGETVNEFKCGHVTLLLLDSLLVIQRWMEE
jgi:hypothetical protein